MNPTRRIGYSALVIAVLLLPTQAAADDWDNSSGDAQWSNSINWSDNTEPTAGESAIFPAGFPNGATTIKLGTGEVAFLVGFGDNYTLANLVPAFDTATLTLADGVVHAVTGKSAQIHVRLNSSNGLTKIGAGSVSLHRTTVIEGAIVVDDGTLGIGIGGNVSCNYGIIADDAGSTGVVTVDGTNARWIISGTLFAGGLQFGDGNGTLNITGGGRVEDIYTILGGLAGSSATINVSGANSFWTTIDDLGMSGRAGSTCVLNFTGGTVTARGVHGGPGVTTLTLDGGTLDTQGSSIGGDTSGQQITNLNFRSGTLRNVSQINGGAALTKTTSGTLILEGPNTYTGDTTVTAGTLKLTGDGSFASSPIISLSAGTTLDVANVSSGLNFNGTSFALAAGQTLVGSGTVIGSIGVGPGSSITISPSQSLTFSNDANIDAGTMTVAGGSLTAPAIIDNGTLNITSGSVNTSVMSAGNNGTLTGGAGTGTISISGGTVNAGSVLLGSSAGGSGDMTVSGTGDITTNRILANDLIVNGGIVTVLDGGEPTDPVLDDSMVAGYVHDGALIVNGGTVTTPRIKLGVTAGKTGTYTQTGGTLDVDVLAIGNTADEFSNTGVGIADISGGTLTAGTVYVGNPGIGAGTFRWSGGTLNVQTLDMAGDTTLGVGLAGPTIGSGYSQLQIAFNANLAGALEIAVAEGFEPAMSQTFVIMTFASSTGTFENVTGMDPGPGKSFHVQHNATNVTLVVVPAVPGDMNCDNAFDIADIAPFVLALTDAAGYQQQFATCDPIIGDMNFDLVLDGRDIGLFVTCLVNGGC